jgi:hypothetical protein
LPADIVTAGSVPVPTDTDATPAELGPDDPAAALDGVALDDAGAALDVAALEPAVLLLAAGVDDPQADSSNTPVRPAARA